MASPTEMLGAPSQYYLEDFSESIATLPAELNKNLTLMGELDAHATEAFKEIEERAAKIMRRAGKSSKSYAEQRKLWEQLAKEHQECLDISEEKVGLAEQTYDLVDGHVRRLDDVLRKFEAELRQIDPDRLAELKLAAVQSDPFLAAGLATGNSRKRGRADSLEADINSDVPVDPNEPRYCYCKQVSFGEMVACDNADCPYEWFHYACVQLDAPPKGDWLCPHCRKAKNK